MLRVTDGMTDEQIDEWIRSQLVGGIRRLKIYNDKTNYKFGHGGNFNIWFFGAVTTEMTGIAIDHWSNQVFSIRISYPDGEINVNHLTGEWQAKSLHRTFTGVNTELWMDIPEIANAKECIFDIGVVDGRYTYRQCTLINVGQSAGFQYIGTINPNQYFAGYIVKNTLTQISAVLNSVGDFEASRIEVIDVVYR